MQAAAATAGTITDLSTGKSKVVVKTAHERVRGEKAVDGAKLSASKKRREKKKKAKAARVAAKATGEIPAKPTNVAILYLREWAAAKATTKQKTSDVVTKTHEWKFQKVRQTWQVHRRNVARTFMHRRKIVSPWMALHLPEWHTSISSTVLPQASNGATFPRVHTRDSATVLLCSTMLFADSRPSIVHAFV